MNDAPTASTTDPASGKQSTAYTSDTYYSIYVPTALPPATVEGTSGYLRVGANDDTQEAQLPLAPTSDQTEKPPSTQMKSPFRPGVLLYSTGVYQCVVAEIQAAAASTLQLTSSGRVVTSATSQETAGVKTTFQLGDTLTASMGNIVTSMFGSQFTHTVGSNATVSMLGRLVCNVGATANVFGGTVVNVSGRGVAVQAAGQYSNFRDYRVCSIGAITFIADLPGTTTAVEAADLWAKRVAHGSIILNAVIAAATGIIGTVIEGKGSAQDANNIKLQLSVLHYSFDAATAAILLAQLGVMLVGAVLQKTKFPTDNVTTAGKPTIRMSSDSIRLQVGSNCIVISSTGIVLLGPLLAQSTQSIELNVPASNLKLKPTSAILNNGGGRALSLSTTEALISSLPNSITLNATYITMAAADQQHIMIKPLPTIAVPVPREVPLF